VKFSLTTNGTLGNRDAWDGMLDEDLELIVSFDGMPEIHDRHRRDLNGRPTAAVVEGTLRELIRRGKTVRVNMVVRPDTVAALPEGLGYVHDLGVQDIDLSLDLWTRWNPRDVEKLKESVIRAARLWRQWLPHFSVSWFDAKVADLARLPSTGGGAWCGFGDGEIAVAPSGHLYPCERLIGEDRGGSPFRLPGNAIDGDDFSSFTTAPLQRHNACVNCALLTACDTGCRCSNYIRTGDINRPDGLLCVLNKTCARAVSEMLGDSKEIFSGSEPSNKKECYVG
jgi:uncharacterized protein